MGFYDDSTGNSISADQYKKLASELDSSEREKQAEQLEGDIIGFTNMTATNAVRRYVLPKDGLKVLNNDYKSIKDRALELEYKNESALTSVDRTYKIYSVLSLKNNNES